MRRRLWLVVIASALWLLPSAARAQSAIAGVVRDTSGAVLPGVTVEAASPALIEKTRSVITDASGQYKIVDLRPGVYGVNFSLAGFTTVKREGIELQANFTASVNAEMKVGGLEESITVSGAAPIVDVQTTQQREVLTRAVLDALPTGRNYQTIGATLPSVSMGRFDVGGSTAMQQSTVISAGSIGGDMAMLVDGMNISSSLNSGSVPATYHNDGAYQEYVYQVSGANAEFSSGGVTINMIPKEGANQVKSDGVALYTSTRFQAANVDDAQRSQGVTTPARIDKTWDYNASIGFPIRKDRLWWFSSARFWGYNNFAPNALDRNGNQVVDDNDVRAWTNRVTGQLNQKNKFTAMYDYLPKFRGHRDIELGTVAPEATVVQRTPASFNTQAKWTSTITSKLLVEAGFSENYYDYTLHYRDEVATVAEKPPFGDVSHVDIVTGRRTVAATRDFEDTFPFYNLYGASSYITGSHALRFGVQWGRGWIKSWRDANGDMVQRYSNGVPNSVQRWNFPIPEARSNLDYLVGVFLQDSWTHRRLTLNPGLRFEAIRGSVPAQSAPAGRFVPARNFAAVENLPNWKNIAPRFGAAYDLFGDGRTAIKGSVGKYMQQEATGFAAKYNGLQEGSDVVTWNDLNGNDIAEDNELGAANNATLGVRRNINPDPDMRRPYQVLYNVGVQHQLMDRLSVSANYFRREYRNLAVTKSLAVPLTAYDLVNLPDPRGNGQTLPIYNLQRPFLGLVNDLDTTSATNWRHYNGVDVTMNARGRDGMSVSGGVSVGRSIANTCDVGDPNQLRFCDQTQYSIPYAKTVKLTWAYPLPWDVRFSGVFQSADGFNTSAPPAPLLAQSPDNHMRLYTYNVTRTQLPALVQSNVSVFLDEPGTVMMPRVTQLDLAFSKSVTVGKFRLTPQVDVFNATNNNAVLTLRTVYGPTLGNPSTILSGRLVRFQIKYVF
ncbi:MAG TPA: TonB-dependent receptor [Vicinamibacterales bacterium]|nr:TonB-dependent receptor [Vicinamibacterales bacterium]